METPADRIRSVACSLGMHAVIVGLLFVGLLRPPMALPDAGEEPMMQATLVAASTLSAPASQRPVAPRESTPPPQPTPEPVPQTAPQPPQPIPQARLPKPDTTDQDEVRRLADQAIQVKQQEQEERHRQDQIDLTRQQEQLEAENRQHMAQQLEDLRKQRADADRQVKLQEQKLKQLQDHAAQITQNAVASPTPAPKPVESPAASSVRGTALDQYRTAIKRVVHANWHPVNVPPGTHCTVHFHQLPGGEVFGDVSFDDCPLDAVARQTIEDALKRTPLPYTGFESVFQREGTIDMCAPEDACQ